MHRGFPLHKGPYPLGTMMEGWTVPEARNSESSSASDESIPTTHSPDTAHSDFHSFKLPEAAAQTAPVVAEGSAPNMVAAECSAPKNAPEATVECSAPKDAPATAVKCSDSKLQVAIQAMMNMGFKNEGGWLSNLLLAKNGDIGKVLDLLHPVKN